jgi:hypothetical protein
LKIDEWETERLIEFLEEVFLFYCTDPPPHVEDATATVYRYLVKELERRGYKVSGGVVEPERHAGSF